MLTRRDSGRASAHHDGTEDPAPPAVAIHKPRILGQRGRRLTVEWVFTGDPVPEWVEAFDYGWRTDPFDSTRVASGYGGPMVLQDKRIVWAVSSIDLRSAVCSVRRAVSFANLHFGSFRAEEYWPWPG